MFSKSLQRLSIKVNLCIAILFLVACDTKVTPPEQTVEIAPSQSDAPIDVKVVVVTMFEIGEDEGDKPGEFQLWKAGQKLSTKFDFPHSHHDIYMNTETGVMGIVTGMGTAKATAAIMALGLDPRFNLSKTYWLVAGIAGFDPADASIGSAAWATWLVDGDLAHQIDAREIPEQWSTGYFPLFANAPYSESKHVSDTQQIANGEVYKLNPSLTEWAFQLTKDIPLTDYPAMAELRTKYSSFENAQKLPFVLKGDHLAASTFWHGKQLNKWANDWTTFWTDGQGNFVSSGMEDTGTMQAIEYLDRVGKADRDRVMVLRTGSNYSMQPDGLSAAENLAMESGEAGFAGMRSALESAYTVGSTVVEALLDDWQTYSQTPPSH
ncbi:purine nucleoside permease [Aliiglaciecola sp. 3_MG-2023]|uniref:purine nucleoside permease n=1 Tax=Aliiglaciecola sp. 3_MG-2023 TaxID=3062644 RepID=UPI0026E29B88|nr:purine nucleoside permease [Aliiglaciecola sp. 3_MG-2023]MDO6695692.1 purine nucleoside permease [Aliiglaciecola sp. 3_MG-2023]